jgi:hypothetical protein
MKFPVLTVLLSTTLAWAAPTRRDADLTDIQVLQVRPVNPVIISLRHVA